MCTRASFLGSVRALAGVSSLALVGTLGCSSPPSEEVSSGEDEIRTATCPATFSLDLDKPAIYTRAPTKDHDGRSLDADERTRVSASMKQAAKFKTIALSFEIDAKKSARCAYRSTVSDGPAAPHAELRGTTSKPLLDVTFGAFHYYASPRTITRDGLTYASGARAGVLAQLGGQGAGGPSTLVKIGNASIVQAPAKPTGDPTIAAAVAELEGEAVLAGPGRNDDFQVVGTSSLDLVKSYIKAKWDDDPDMVSSYTYQANAPSLVEDEPVAGTMTKDVAVEEAVAAVTHWYDVRDPAADGRIAKVRSLLEAMDHGGASFGFDGFAQNGCAAPTAFLLVIDPKAKVVYGVDLNPCEE